MARKYRNVADYVSKTEKILGVNTLKAGLFIESSIKAAFPPSGSRGSLSGGGNPSNPSKPGEIPHVQTGTEKRSIKTGQLEKKKRIMFVKVGSILKPQRGAAHSYPYIQEFGRGDTRRPWLRPAIKRDGKRAVRIITTGRA